MKLNKPTDEQIRLWEEEKKDREKKLTPGAAKFYVKEAKDCISKAGNEMITLTLQVTDCAGVTKVLWTNLVNTPNAIYKIEHFCEQVGLTKEFEAGELEDYMCLNKEGICILKLQKSAKYGEQTVINDFAKPDVKFEEFKDDDVPF